MTDIIRDAFLSEKIYEDLEPLGTQPFGIPGGSSDRFVIKDILNDPVSGAYGAVIHDTVTGDGIFIARGSQDVIDFTDADLNILFQNAPENQLNAVFNFINSYNSNSGNTGFIPLTNATGHSLGGPEAEAVGIANNLEVTTFGAPGVPDLLSYLENKGFSNEVANYYFSKNDHYSFQDDPVGTFGTHTGNTHLLDGDGVVSQSIDGYLASAIINAIDNLQLTTSGLINVSSPALGLSYDITELGLGALYYHPINNYAQILSGDSFSPAVVDLGGSAFSYVVDGTVRSYQIDDPFYLETATGQDFIDLMLINNFQDNFLTLYDSTDYFIYEDTMVIRTLADTVFEQYQVFNFTDPVYDSLLDLITTPANNQYFDYDNFFNGGAIQQDRPNSVVWQDGQAFNGGNYSGTADPSILNGDGYQNVIPSGIVTDSYSPGRGILSNSEFFFESYTKASVALLESMGNLLDDVYPGYTSYIMNSYVDALSLLNIDPLVLDMDGDGVELIAFEDSHATFDVDNDGYIESTGWVSKDDAILVHDFNGDGLINDITETISEYYLAAPGTGALYEDGFEALATLDSNADGVFDANDTAFSSLRIWQDANENGITEAGELITLSDAGVQSIDLNKELVTRTEIEGNPVFSRSTVTINGVQHDVASIDFVTNALGYEWNEITEGLHIATENGEAATLQVQDTGGVTIDLSVLNTDGNAANDANVVVGNIGDDTITGDSGDNWLVGAGGSDTLNGGAGNDLLMIDADDDMANIDAGSGFDIIQATGDRGVIVNLADVNAEVGIGGAGRDTFFGGGNTNVFIRGGAGDDVIIGGSADDALSGEDGDDMLDGGYGDDVLRGHRGEDTLIGNVGEDYLDGGLGDDKLYGGADDDLLKGGGGNDQLYGGDGYDVAEFSGNKDDYDITFLGNETFRIDDKIAGRDGTDILRNVEALNFKDIINLDLAWQNPWTVDDIIEISGSGPYTLLASDILANEVDFQNDDVHITEITATQGGTAVLEANGDVTFTPDADFNGVMSFRYKIADSSGNPGADVTHNGSAPAEVEGTVYLKEPHHPDDPLFYDQWYLSETNILPVWQDYTGKGINIGVYEPGILDRDHIDLADNIAQETLDNAVFFEDDHATLVSGIIAASNNGMGSIGVAYDAKLHGNGGNDPNFNPETYDLEGIIDFSNEAQYDITNHSIGNTNAFERFADANAGEGGVLPSTDDGRNGLGTINIWGAGNGRAEGRNTNDFDVTTFSDVIVVGAINKEANLGSLEIQYEPFSTPGANILISAPGSNISSTSLLLENSNGSTFGNDYEVAEGTSFATPIVSGIAALMLEANPNLGYRDVQEILAYTARIVDDQNTDWQINGARNWNGGGLHFSHDYGFGNVDALAAVRLAETWHKQETADNRVTTSTPYQSSNLNQTIPDGGTLVDTVDITSTAPLEFINVTLDFVHDQVGDLIIKLISPSGTESILLNRQGKALDDPNDRGHGAEDMVYSFGTRAHMGEQSEGTWTLEVTDAVGGGVGTLRSWEISFSAELPEHFVGEIPPANSTYIYTDEYLDQTDPAREILDDGGASDLEDDTINVAAMTGDVNLDLTPGATSSLSGKSLQISADTLIERAFTGDGDDTILGNNVINLLWGGRGNDVIDGGLGNDWIFGKSGNNTLIGGGGGDRFVIQQGDSGEQHIQDFNIADGDTIVIANYEGLDGFNDLTFVQEGADTKFTMPDGQEVVLAGILPGQLTEQQFIFDPEFKHLDIKVEEITYTSGDDDVWVNIFTGALIHALEGNDVIRGTFGDDVIYGGSGDDVLLGSYSDDPGWSNVTESGGGADVLYGGEGNDSLYGSGMSDTLIGGAGADVLVGNRGDDIIYLDGSADQALGGEGDDTYVIERLASGTDGADLIHDFDLNEDKIDLRAFSEIRDFNDITLEADQVTVNSELRDIVRVWVTQGAIEQQIQLLDLSDTSLITEENFIFNTAEPIRPKLDTFDVNEDGQLIFSEADLLANDGDDVIPEFSKILVGPQNGSLIDDGNGNFTYTPEANYFGEDKFTYEVKNAEGASATSTVFLNVTPTDDAPSTDMPSALYAKTGKQFIYKVNFEDADGDLLSYSASLQDGSSLPAWLSFDPETQIISGTAPLLPEDVLLRFTATDGTHQTEHDLTLSVTTRAPEAVEDSFSEPEDQIITGNVLNNDSDIDGDTLSVQPLTGLETVQGGTVDLLADGNFTYTPAADFNGTDSFNYTLLDGQGGTDTGTVNLTIDPVNDVSVLTNNGGAVDEDTTLVLTTAMLEATDVDNTPDELVFTINAQPANGVLALSGVTLAANDTFTMQDILDGNVTFAPDGNYNGTDSFDFTLSDGTDTLASQTFDITVNSVNDAPVAQNDSVVTDENTANTVTVLANDTDADLDTLDVVSVGTAANGTAVLNADNTITYSPDTDFSGSDSFTYTVSDGNGGSDTATVNVTVNGVDNPPILTNNGGTGDEDNALTLTTSMLSIADVDTTPNNRTFTLQSLPSQGTLYLNGVALVLAAVFTQQDLIDSLVTYEPNADYNGADSFDFSASDGTTTLPAQTFDISIAAVNDNPEAVNDTVTTDEDTAVTLDVRSNDTDVELDNLEVESVTQGTNGSVIINPDGTVSYTPDSGFNGTDSFTYTINDGNGGTSTATVDVTVNSLNDLPVLTNNGATVDEDTALVLTAAMLEATDTDNTSAELVFTVNTLPANGVLALNGVTLAANETFTMQDILDGNVTFEPDGNYNGNDGFDFTLSDGTDTLASQTFGITVNSINDNPTAQDDVFTGDEGTDIIGNVLADNGNGVDSDPDGDALSVTAGTFATTESGSVTIVANGDFTYTPDTGYVGSDSFTYTLEDGNGGSDTATVNITVDPLEVAPEISGLVDGLGYVGQTYIADGSTNTSTTDIVPNLTSNNSQGVVVNQSSHYTSTSIGNFYGYYAFNGTESGRAWAGLGGSGPTGWLEVDLPQAHVVNKYQIYTRTDYGGQYSINAAPKNWQLLGSNNGSSWTVLDTVTNQTGWSVGEGRTFTFENTTAYDHYKINVTANNGYSNYVAIGEINLIGAQMSDGSLKIDEDISLSDVDSAALSGAEVHLSGVLDSGQEVLSVTTTGGITASYGTDGGDMVLTLSGNASVADYEQVLESLTYNNTAGSITAGQRTLEISITDDTGQISEVAEVALDVSESSTNAPSYEMYSAVVTEDDSIVLTTSLLSASDIDTSDSALIFTLNGVPANGDLSLSDTALQVSDSFSQQDIVDGLVSYIPSANYNGSDSFAFTLSDGQNTLSSDVFDITINAVEDVLTANGDNLNVLYETESVFDVLVNDISDDPVALSVSAVTQGDHGTVVINADNTLTYTPNAGYLGSDSFTYTVDDGNGSPDTATVDITVVAAPEISGLVDGLGYVGQTYIANGSTNTSTTDIVPNLTSNNSQGVVVNQSSHYTSTSLGNFYGYYAFNGTEAGRAWAGLGGSGPTGWLTVDLPSEHVVNKYQIYTRTDYGGQYSINAAPKNWQLLGSNNGSSWTVLDTVTNETGWGVGEGRTFTFENTVAYDHYKLNITANNGYTNYVAVGEINLIGAQMNDGSLKIDEDISLSDVDNANLSGAEVRLSGVLNSGQEILSVDTAGGITVSYAADGSDMVLTLSGNASVATYEQVLESLTYNNTAGSITAGQRTLEITITDETGQISEVANVDINVLNPDALYGTNGNDMLQGDANDNLIYGEDGNDVLYGNNGLDTLFGGSGQDTFVFEQNSAFNDVDVIKDYSLVDGDVIDIADLLTVYDPLQYAIDNFVTLTESGSDTVISVDQDGTGGTYSAQQVANIENTTGLDLNDMITNGELLVA